MTYYERVIHMANDCVQTHEAKVDDPWKRLAAAVILQGLIDGAKNCDGVWIFDSGTLQWRFRKGFPEASYEFYSSLAGIDADYSQLVDQLAGSHTSWQKLGRAFG